MDGQDVLLTNGSQSGLRAAEALHLMIGGLNSAPRPAVSSCPGPWFPSASAIGGGLPCSQPGEIGLDRLQCCEGQDNPVPEVSPAGVQDFDPGPQGFRLGPEGLQAHGRDLGDLGLPVNPRLQVEPAASLSGAGGIGSVSGHGLSLPPVWPVGPCTILLDPGLPGAR